MALSINRAQLKKQLRNDRGGPGGGFGLLISSSG